MHAQIPPSVVKYLYKQNKGNVITLLWQLRSQRNTVNSKLSSLPNTAVVMTFPNLFNGDVVNT